jgi:hypothetical protein
MLGAVLMRSAARRIAVVLTLILGTPAGMIIAGATPQASACSLTSRCYAISENANTNTNYGIRGSVNAHCLYVPNNANFVTNEIWDASPSYDSWEEVGIFSGLGDQIAYGDRNWFWEDSRPGGGVNEHDSSVEANTDTNYRVKVEFEGNDTWYIYGNGNFSHFGTSTNQSAALNHGQAGTEYTANSGAGMRNQGRVDDLQRIDTSHTYYHWGANLNLRQVGYIVPDWDESSSTVYWTGPC